MNIRFDGKTAIVTGAGSGFGRGLALKLVECGAEVIAISLIQAELDELTKTNEKIKTICLDVGDWKATESVLSNIGPVDLLVNNAGIGSRGLFGEITESEVDLICNVNVKAIINISQIVAKGMKSRGKGGSIVNISSVLGLKVLNGLSMYCSTKASVVQLTRSMALEFGPYNIRVNSVNPSFVPTKLTENFFAANNPVAKSILERTPLGRFGEVENIVHPILFLLSEYASMITGVTLPIDGGITVCL